MLDFACALVSHGSGNDGLVCGFVACSGDGGGGELVIAGRGCAMVIVLGISVASFASAWDAVALAADCLWLACAVAFQAYYCVVPGLIEESGCFCAASSMVWVCCELPDLPISVDFRYLRGTVSASERAEWARHVG